MVNPLFLQVKKFSLYDIGIFVKMKKRDKRVTLNVSKAIAEKIRKYEENNNKSLLENIKDVNNKNFRQISFKNAFRKLPFYQILEIIEYVDDFNARVCSPRLYFHSFERNNRKVIGKVLITKEGQEKVKILSTSQYIKMIYGYFKIDRYRYIYQIFKALTFRGRLNNFNNVGHTRRILFTKTFGFFEFTKKFFGELHSQIAYNLEEVIIIGPLLSSFNAEKFSLALKQLLNLDINTGLPKRNEKKGSLKKLRLQNLKGGINSEGIRIMAQNFKSIKIFRCDVTNAQIKQLLQTKGSRLEIVSVRGNELSNDAFGCKPKRRDRIETQNTKKISLQELMNQEEKELESRPTNEKLFESYNHDLKYLCLDSNEFSDLTCFEVARSKSLRKIYYRNGINYIQERRGQISTLSNVDDGSKFTEEGIYAFLMMKDLRKINIGNVQFRKDFFYGEKELKRIDNFIKENSKLEIFNLSSSKTVSLYFLNSLLNTNKTLRQLLIYDCLLFKNQLEAIAKFTNLSSLALNGMLLDIEQLNFIGDGASKDKIQTLDIGNNDLTNLAITTCCWKKFSVLKELDIAGNTNIDESILLSIPSKITQLICYGTKIEKSNNAIRFLLRNRIHMS